MQSLVLEFFLVLNSLMGLHRINAFQANAGWCGSGQCRAKESLGPQIWAQVSSPYDLDSYNQFTVREKRMFALTAELDFESLF